MLPRAHYRLILLSFLILNSNTLAAAARPDPTELSLEDLLNIMIT